MMEEAESIMEGCGVVMRVQAAMAGSRRVPTFRFDAIRSCVAVVVAVVVFVAACRSVCTMGRIQAVDPTLGRLLDHRFSNNRNDDPTEEKDDINVNLDKLLVIMADVVVVVVANTVITRLFPLPPRLLVLVHKRNIIPR
jgi:hypothetical protein